LKFSSREVPDSRSFFSFRITERAKKERQALAAEQSIGGRFGCKSRKNTHAGFIFA
jgi:hypothetical protein